MDVSNKENFEPIPGAASNEVEIKLGIVDVHNESQIDLSFELKPIR